MKTSSSQWKDKLQDKLPEQLDREINIFETEIDLRKQGKIEEKLFAETRLRRGAYGQRYDNGRRHDGMKTQALAYQEKESKGPNTVWDAPGMLRIKIPYGGMSPEKLELMADVAEEYSLGLAHVTTRQDFQLHYIQIEDTPSLMRRLASVGITTREACGNSVRNVTACPYTGVCCDEAFDVTPYAQALSRFLLGHPDAQDFGRKFKPAFSGCKQQACGLVMMHDLGCIAVTREVDGKTKRGFEFYVGGGLGAVPHQAKLLEDFLPPEELLPMAQAIARVYARLGEKKNRNRARIKFLIKDLGVEEFKRLVQEERKKLPHDERWTSYIEEEMKNQEEPKRSGGEEIESNGSDEFRRWLKTNVRPQRQPGYVTVTVALPLGDITSLQLRDLADIVRRFTRGTIRTTVEQNAVLRWISKADLNELYNALVEANLGESGACNLYDVTACPGTDTCKLGISSSRGLAAELRNRLEHKYYNMDEAIQNLHIKISGCFNSCGQHHVADLGFYGVSRSNKGFKVPGFQVVLGGQWEENAGSFGLPIMAIPSKNVPEVVDRITSRYVKEREKGEKFKAFIDRIGKVEVKKMLQDLANVPDHEVDSSKYADWGDPREYSLLDRSEGECAGEVVPLVEFGLAAAERGVFEAQIALEEGNAQGAAKNAYRAMLDAAKALIKTEFLDVSDNDEQVVSEFRRRFFDTHKFFDPYAGGKFAQYLFDAHGRNGRTYDVEAAHHMIEEAQLFVEAAHSCYHRMRTDESVAGSVKG